MNNNIKKIDTLAEHNPYFTPGDYSSYTHKVIMCVFCEAFQNIDIINETLSIKWKMLNKYFGNNIGSIIKLFLNYGKPYDKFKYNKQYCKKYYNLYYKCNTYSQLVISIFAERGPENYFFNNKKCYYNKYCVCENEGLNQPKYYPISLPKTPRKIYYICVPCTFKSLQSVKDILDSNTNKYILSEDRLSYTNGNNIIHICDCFKYKINITETCINMLCTTSHSHIDIPCKKYNIIPDTPCGKHCIQYHK